MRPGRSSRPRTRRRPPHDDAVTAFVTQVDRGRYGCLAEETFVVAMKARELGRRSVVVGDMVALAGDATGVEGTLARIVRVQPRASALRRSADDTDPVERVIVANADQLVIVCSLAQPAPRPGFVDRCLVAAYDADIDPVLCLTKADLAGSDEVDRWYAPLGLRRLVTRRPLPPEALDSVRATLADRVSVLVGQSGVGKSTLVNTLVPAADRSVGAVNPVTGQGRHTSSSAVALRLPGGGWLIDTPGLRGFGLGHVTADRVVRAFPELAEATQHCPPGCDHLGAARNQAAVSAFAAAPTVDDAGSACALDAWAGAHGAEIRLASLRRLLRSRDDTTGRGQQHPPRRPV